MSASVKGMLADLMLGALWQRLAQAAAVILLARELGVEQLGAYAFGLQLGALLSLLTDSGPRVVAAREAAADPEQAWTWIQSSVRARLLRATLLYLLFAGCVAAACREPLFLLLCGIQIIIGVFDLKGLAEAVGLSRLEVLLEGVASALYLGLVVALMLLESASLPALVGAFLAGRTLYALLAMARLPLIGRDIPAWKSLARGAKGLSIALLANNLIRSCDILLLRWLAGTGPAGLFHAAYRVALAAEAPLMVLARLTRPHLHHAASRGDFASTLERMIRASAFWILPVAAGGWIVSESLLTTLFGQAFAEGAWTLRWLLVAALVSGLGSHLGGALFARRRLAHYLYSLGASMLLNLLLSLLLIPLWGAAGTALATVLGLAVGVLLALALLRREVAFAFWPALLRPLAVALATLACAWAVPADLGLALRLSAGALGFGLALYCLELRGRWRGLGSGLEGASGFLVERKGAGRAG